MNLDALIHRSLLMGGLSVFPAGIAQAQNLPELETIRKQASDGLVCRPAWESLVKRGPAALLPILEAWPKEDPVAGHWLRTAFEKAAVADPKQLPLDGLLAFAKEPQKPGKARRLALQTLEMHKPGTTADLVYNWLNDPEFRADAVAERLARIQKLSDDKEKVAALKVVFAATQDAEQATALAKKLKDMGETVDVLAHLGIVQYWHVIGPFPVTCEEGLQKSFPPEKEIRFEASYPGKDGELRWKPRKVQADGKLDLIQAGFSVEKGSVAYAVAKFNLPEKITLELKAGVVDNITAWVDGKKIVEIASTYRSMFRADRHRGLIELPAGEHTLLLKLTKTQTDEGRPGAPPRWETQVRFANDQGQGVAVRQMKLDVPDEKPKDGPVPGRPMPPAAGESKNRPEKPSPEKPGAEKGGER